MGIEKIAPGHFFAHRFRVCNDHDVFSALREPVQHFGAQHNVAGVHLCKIPCPPERGGEEQYLFVMQIGSGFLKQMLQIVEEICGAFFILQYDYMGAG